MFECLRPKVFVEIDSVGECTESIFAMTNNAIVSRGLVGSIGNGYQSRHIIKSIRSSRSLRDSEDGASWKIWLNSFLASSACVSAVFFAYLIEPYLSISLRISSTSGEVLSHRFLLIIVSTFLRSVGLALLRRCISMRLLFPSRMSPPHSLPYFCSSPFKFRISSCFWKAMPRRDPKDFRVC